MHDVSHEVWSSDILGIESSLSMQGLVRLWNISIYRWLRKNVYSRLPFHSNALRRLVTFVVSAIWHGLEPGYHLFFVSIPFFFEVEGRYRRSDSEIRSALPRWLHWCLPMVGYLWTHLSYYYLGVGFCFLDWQKTMRVWSSVGYFGHVMCALAFLFQAVVLPARKKTKHVE